MPDERVISLLLSICGFLLTGISAWFVLEFREMRKSIESLNLKISHIVSKIEAHEIRIERIEGKVDLWQS